MKYLKSKNNVIFSGFDFEARIKRHEEVADFVWFVGAIVSVMFPLLICFVYLGLTAALVYAFSLVAGIVGGVVWHFRFPRRNSSCVNTGVLSPNTWQTDPVPTRWSARTAEASVN